MIRMRAATTRAQIHNHPQIPKKSSRTILRYSRTGCEPLQHWLNSLELNLRYPRSGCEPLRCGPESAKPNLMYSWTGCGPRDSRPKSILRIIENSRRSLRSLCWASDSERVRPRRDQPRIPFHQPPRRGNEDDETIPGALDAIDEAEVTPERRTTSLPPSRVAKVAQRLDLNQADHGQAQRRGSSYYHDLPSGQTGTDSRATKRSSESAHHGP